MDTTCGPEGVEPDIELMSADGTRLVARRTGTGVPVVLVHGSAGGLGSWDPVTAELPEVEAWTYARRGYEPSDAPRVPKTFTDDVADLRTVLDAAGTGAHVVGGSYGATVALHAAAAGLPMASLSLFEPPLFAAGVRLAPVLATYRSHLADGRLDDASHLFAADVARVPDELLAMLAGEEPAPEAERRAEARGCLHDLEAMAADADDVARWSTIDRPVLLIQGENTWPPIPASMDALAAVLQEVERIELPGQMHFAPHTAPDLFAEALRTSLA